MITNGKCTVVRADEAPYIVWQGDCMWQGDEGFEIKKYGEERADQAVVFIPEIVREIAKGDMIIREETEDCDHVVRHGLTIMSVSCRDYGSPALQHTELGVR